MFYGFDHAKSRPETCRLLDMLDNGEIDPRVVADMCLGWLSEASVKEMMQANDIPTTSQLADEEDESEEAEDPLDNFDYVGSRHHY